MAKAIAPDKAPSKKKRKLVKILYSVVLIMVIAFGSFFFIRYIQVNSKYKDAIMTQDQRNQKTLAAIGKLMDLPKDEKPTDIIVIKDKEKLNSPNATKQFYATAKNNDILVAYKNANMSLIYRPDDKKIIKTDNYTNFFAATYPVNIAILAPSDKQADTEQLITTKVLNVNIVSKEVPKINSAQSYVADVTGTNGKAAQELADKIGLPVGQLPTGEAKPDGASLVVVIAALASPTPAP